jgi:hypothetical protein
MLTRLPIPLGRTRLPLIRRQLIQLVLMRLPLIRLVLKRPGLAGPPLLAGPLIRGPWHPLAFAAPQASRRAAHRRAPCS